MDKVQVWEIKVLVQFRETLILVQFKKFLVWVKFSKILSFGPNWEHFEFWSSFRKLRVLVEFWEILGLGPISGNIGSKSGLDLDGFIREIGRRQKSFDLRQKICLM